MNDGMHRKHETINRQLLWEKQLVLYY